MLLLLQEGDFDWRHSFCAWTMATEQHQVWLLLGAPPPFKKVQKINPNNPQKTTSLTPQTPKPHLFAVCMCVLWLQVLVVNDATQDARWVDVPYWGGGVLECMSHGA